MAVKVFDFGVAPYVDETKKLDITTPYPSILASINYTQNPELWSYYPGFSTWNGKVMNGESFTPEIIEKLHQSFQLGLHSSAGIPRDPIPIDNGHSSYKDMKQECFGYVIDTAVCKGSEIVDIVNGQASSRKCPEETLVLMLKIAWLPSGFQAVASGSAPSISISMDTFENGNVILRQSGLVTRPADNWLPKLAAFEEKEVTKLVTKFETKKFMDANSPIMQAWMELLAGMDEAEAQAMLDKIKGETVAEPVATAELAPTFAVETPVTMDAVKAAIAEAINGLTAQPVAAIPPAAPSEGMLTARFESADLPFEIGEKLEIKCKDFTPEKATEYVKTFKASYNPPKAGHDLPEADIDINKVPASVMGWK